MFLEVIDKDMEGQLPITHKLAYSVEEIAELTTLSPAFLRQKIGKELKVTRFGRRVLVLREDLERFLKNGVE